MSKILIIAEAGVNHNGDINLAKKLIIAAKNADADFVKFQTFITEKNICLNAPKADYQKISSGIEESQYQMVKRLELDKVAHEFLIAECQNYGIGFFSTGFDPESIDLPF